MPAIAAISLGVNAPSTPATEDTTIGYFPVRIEGNVARWRDGVSDVLAATAYLSHSIKLPANGSQVARVQAKLTQPLFDGDGNPLGTAIANLEFVLPKGCDSNQRLAFYHQVRSMTDLELMANSVIDYEGVY